MLIQQTLGDDDDLLEEEEGLDEEDFDDEDESEDEEEPAVAKRIDPDEDDITHAIDCPLDESCTCGDEDEAAEGLASQG